MRKVMVLEDESSIRSFIVINLRRAGYEVVEAETGEEALDKLHENPDTLVALQAQSHSGLKKAAQALRQAFSADLYGAGETTLPAAVGEALERHDKLLICADAAAGAAGDAAGRRTSAISCPTVTSSSGLTNQETKVPFFGDSTGNTALSVSSSQRASSHTTGSPGFFESEMMRALWMPSPSIGT